ncbi:protein gar2, partial [Tanacetum coccineum]
GVFPAIMGIGPTAIKRIYRYNVQEDCFAMNYTPSSSSLGTIDFLCGYRPFKNEFITSILTNSLKESGDNVVCSVSEGKLRRRTCYECGERGHLSSLCPKKQTTNAVVSKKEVIDMEIEKVEEVKSVAIIGNEGDNNVASSVYA